ncbi:MULTISPECIES: hypothetical protein [unclassified Cupriavidus]|uniref:hypothetical protein n=1 Tax=unclassified Cupriavidus TaxID=2640874 RepID=UPI00313DF80D
MHELTKPHSFVSDAAFDLAASGGLPPKHSLEFLNLLDTVRDVAAGTSLVLRMVVNADVMDACEGPKPQISRTDLFMLQTLCQAAQGMIESRVEKLLDDINDAAETYEASHG